MMQYNNNFNISNAEIQYFMLKIIKKYLLFIQIINYN